MERPLSSKHQDEHVHDRPSTSTPPSQSRHLETEKGFRKRKGMFSSGRLVACVVFQTEIGRGARAVVLRLIPRAHDDERRTPFGRSPCLVKGPASSAPDEIALSDIIHETVVHQLTLADNC